MFQVDAHTPNDLGLAVYRLVAENLDLMDMDKRLKQAPLDPLESYVKYRREPPHVNRFLNYKDMLREGFGDCEDLAAWLIAYFKFLGFVARPVLKQVSLKMFHVLCEVYMEGKWYEIDPSKLKGM